MLQVIHVNVNSLYRWNISIRNILYFWDRICQTQPRACSLSVANTRTRCFSHYDVSPWKKEVYEACGGDAATPITSPLCKNLVPISVECDVRLDRSCLLLKSSPIFAQWCHRLVHPVRIRSKSCAPDKNRVCSQQSFSSVTVPIYISEYAEQWR